MAGVDAALIEVAGYAAASVLLVMLAWAAAGASRLFVEAAAEAHELGYTGLGAGLWRMLRGPLERLDVALGVSVAIFGWMLVVGVGPAGGVVLASFVALGLVLSRVDALTETLPDLLTQPLVWLGLAASVTLAGWPVSPADAIAGSMVGYGAVGGLGAVARLRANAELGEGDAKLAGALGAWLGVFGSVAALLVATAAALAWIALDVRARKGLSFGPFLVAGGMLVAALRWTTGPLDKLF